LIWQAFVKTVLIYTTPLQRYMDAGRILAGVGIKDKYAWPVGHIIATGGFFD